MTVKINGENLRRREGCKEKQRRKKLKTNKDTKKNGW